MGAGGTGRLLGLCSNLPGAGYSLQMPDARWAPLSFSLGNRLGRWGLRLWHRGHISTPRTSMPTRPAYLE